MIARPASSEFSDAIKKAFVVSREVIIKPLRRDHFCAWVGDLELVGSSATPGFDTARALLALGLTGKFHLRHANARHWSLEFDIERDAGRTVIENSREGPRFGRWRPFPNENRDQLSGHDGTAEEGRGSAIAGLAPDVLISACSVERSYGNGVSVADVLLADGVEHHAP